MGCLIPGGGIPETQYKNFYLQNIFIYLGSVTE